MVEEIGCLFVWFWRIFIIDLAFVIELNRIFTFLTRKPKSDPSLLFPCVESWSYVVVGICKEFDSCQFRLWLFPMCEKDSFLDSETLTITFSSRDEKFYAVYFLFVNGSLTGIKSGCCLIISHTLSRIWSRRKSQCQMLLSCTSSAVCKLH